VVLDVFNVKCLCTYHKKYKKKRKKRKHHKHTSDTAETEELEHRDKLTDSISLSSGNAVSVPHEHGTTSFVTETIVDSQSELRDKKLHKKKRRHHQEDVFDQQKQSKYHKVEGDKATSVKKNVQSRHKEHHGDSNSKKHTSVEKLQKQLLYGMKKHHKHTTDTAETEVELEHRDKLTDSISLSSGNAASVPHKRRTASVITETIVDSQSKLQDKKLHKKKRRHHQGDLFEQQKHCKYEKVEGNNATSVKENVHNRHKEHHDDSNSKKHTSVEQLQKQLLFGMQQGTDSSQQEKHRKKKKKMKNLCHSAPNSLGTPHDAECVQLQKHKKMKRSKKVGYNEDVLQQGNLPNDLSKHDSLHLPVLSVNVDSGSENATTSTGISELTCASPDEVKYIEHVCKEHKSSILKHKQLTVHTDVESKNAGDYQVVTSKAPADIYSEVHTHSPRKKLISEQHLNPTYVLKLLHAENSLQYLQTETAIKTAGEHCMAVLLTICIFSFNCILLPHDAMPVWYMPLSCVGVSVCLSHASIV